MNDQPTPQQPQPVQPEPASDFSTNSPHIPPPNKPDALTIAKHLGLFLLTFACVTLAGAQFVGFGQPVFPLQLPTISDALRGALFASLLLGFLAVHEFGHYFTAVYHRIRTSLPYFIPVPFGLGTFGAVIRIRQKINHSKQMFDVGVAGPLAGFIVSIGVLLVGFFTLPEPSYILNFSGHEAVKSAVQATGMYPTQPPQTTGDAGTLMVGPTLLYSFLAQFFQDVPPMWEMYHYPLLFAGWLGVFFTALNLTPVGQLDGGHILYALIGFKNHQRVARLFFAVLVTMGGIQAIPSIHAALGAWDYPSGGLSLLLWAGILFLLLRRAFNSNHQWIAPTLLASLAVTVGYLYFVAGNISSSGSLIWVFWSFFIAFAVGVDHPPARIEKPLGTGRTILGWAAMVVFVLCISPNPLYIT